MRRFILKRVSALPIYYGWIIASAASVSIMMAMTLTVTTMSAFVTPLSREFGWSRGEISGAVSFGTVGAAIAGPLCGRWVDRYGARALLTVGSLVMAGSLCALASMQNLFMFYVAFAIGRTVMMNVEHLIAPTAAANWFIHRRAIATALVLASSRLGLGLWPLIAGLLFAVTTWRTAFWFFAIVVALSAPVPWFFIVARRPEEVGLVPDGANTVRSTANPEQTGPESHWQPRDAVRTSVFWILTAVNTITLFVGSGVGLHRIPYFIDKGLSPSYVGPVLACFALGMAIGGFIAARLLVMLSERLVMALLFMLGAALMMLLLVIPGNSWTIIYGLLDGVIFGGLLTIQPVIYANYFGRNSVGTIRGFANPMMMLGNAAGALFAGVLYDLSSNDYTGVFAIFFCLLVFSAGLALLAHAPGRH